MVTLNKERLPKKLQLDELENETDHAWDKEEIRGVMEYLQATANGDGWYGLTENRSTCMWHKSCIKTTRRPMSVQLIEAVTIAVHVAGPFIKGETLRDTAISVTVQGPLHHLFMALYSSWTLLSLLYCDERIQKFKLDSQQVQITGDREQTS